MILLLFVLNLAISIVNAIGCGRSWNESRAAGGMPHFLNWCAAIMAAAGFTWCYLLVVGLAGATVPIEHDDGTTAPYLTMAQVEVFFDLGYLVIIGPILGSGIVLLLHSWRVAWESRTIADVGVSSYNMLANGYNIYSAIRQVPDASRSVTSFFNSKDDNGKGLVLLLVVASVFAGVFTTYLIIRIVARNTAKERSCRLQMQEAARS